MKDVQEQEVHPMLSQLLLEFNDWTMIVDILLLQLVNSLHQQQSIL